MTAIEIQAHESAVLRRLAFAGARYGPSWFVKYSPPLIGAAFALALPRERRKIRDILRWVQGPRPPATERREVLRTFCDYAACLAEGLGAERADARRTRVTVSGEEHLRAIVDSGRGAVLVTAHVGPWDVAARLLSADLGAKVALVMEAEPNAAARAFHDDVRRRTGVEVLSIGGDVLAALPVLRHLRAGGLAAFQIDRPARSARSLEVTLFGRSFAVPEGPFRLAALARVPIVPLFSYRGGYFVYGVEASAPLECAGPVTHAALESAARTSAERMERFIRAHPTQWFHFGAV